MKPVTALLDANVLYPAPMRDLLLQLAVSDLYRVLLDGRHSPGVDGSTAAS